MRGASGGFGGRKDSAVPILTYRIRAEAREGLGILQRGDLIQ